MSQDETEYRIHSAAYHLYNFLNLTKLVGASEGIEPELIRSEIVAEFERLDGWVPPNYRIDADKVIELAKDKADGNIIPMAQ